MAIAGWLQECAATGATRCLLTAFRGSGKSTLAALLAVWLLSRDPDLRILVLAAESSLSSKMTRNIRKIIETHPMTRHLIPKKTEQWASDAFTVNRARVSRDPSVVSKSLGANITGTHADVVICDDVEVPGTCDTAEKRRKLRENLSEIEYILTPGGRVLYIGTPHHYDTIYADTPRTAYGQTDVFLKGYARLCVPVVDGRGRSAWPERYPPAEIDAIRRRSGPMKFSAQMMLEPVNVTEGRLDAELLRPYSAELEYSEAQRQARLTLGGRRLVSCSAWWDPAFGGPQGDGSVLAIVYTDEEGDYWLHRTIYLQQPAHDKRDNATWQCQQVADAARDFHVPSVTVETNGVGRFLPGLLLREAAERKAGCAVVGTVSHRAKDARILEGFDAVMAARALHVHESVYRTPFITEMQEWRPGVPGMRDDGLDAAAGAIAQQPVRLRRGSGAARPAWQGGGESFRAKSDFEV